MMKNINKLFKIGFLALLLLLTAHPPVTAGVLTDDELLELVERRAFDFFWEEANPSNGLIKDRANNFTPDDYAVASIASVGFGLTAICIADARGWISSEEAYDRVLTTLRTFRNGGVESVEGFFYHFLDMNTGQRAWDCELSSIDTTLFLAGALYAGRYFRGTPVETLAREIYEQVDWQWMAHNRSNYFVDMGWQNPTDGFLNIYWNSYNEGILLYFLAIGSPTHPIDSDVWKFIGRPVGSYGEYNFVYVGQNSLFAHQYPYLWLNLKNRKDGKGYDYFDNSRKATLANRQYCIDNQASFSTYGTNSWGITACDGPDGYKAYTAPPTGSLIKDDGTIAPTAAGGSLIFTSTESIAVLRNFYQTYSETTNRLWGRYGFSDAFNLSVSSAGWFGQDVIGIDQGAILLAIENYRSGLVWDDFMKIDCIQTAMSKLNFTSEFDVTPSQPISGAFTVKSYPNPFYLSKNKTNTISYRVAEEGPVKLRVYSLSGQLIREWDQGRQAVGEYKFGWSGENESNELIASGIYLLVLYRQDQIMNRTKIAVIK
ncbi:MAG: glucoamylase family protein [Elusimicrobiota bacterium]